MKKTVNIFETTTIKIVTMFTILVGLMAFNSFGAQIETTQSGNWHDKNTWDCNCVPKRTDNVIIKGEHTVTVDQPALIKDVMIREHALLMVTNPVAFIHLTGNWTNDGDFEHGNSRVIASGDEAQHIAGLKKTVFYEFEVNKRSNPNDENEVVMESAMDIEKKLHLKSGVLRTNELEKTTIKPNGDISGGSDRSYINGPVFIETDHIKEIVIGTGKNGKGKKTQIATETDDPSLFMVEYRAQAHNDLDHVGQGLDHVCANEHWIIERLEGNARLSVSLFWEGNTACGRINNTQQLRVAKYDGHEWKDAGTQELIGNSSAGSIKSEFMYELGTFAYGCSHGRMKKQSGDDNFDVIDQEESIQIASEISIKSFPMPFTGESLNIELDGLKGKTANIKLVDILGNEYLSETIELTGSHYLIENQPVDNFAKGVYLIIVDNEGTLKQEKIIIQ